MGNPDEETCCSPESVKVYSRWIMCPANNLPAANDSARATGSRRSPGQSRSVFQKLSLIHFLLIIAS